MSPTKPSRLLAQSLAPTNGAQPARPNPQRPKRFDFSRLHARQRRERVAGEALARELQALVRRVVPPLLVRFGASRGYLFGSIAAGRAHARSDVDLLVLGVGAAAYWELRHALEAALARPVDLLTGDDDPVIVDKIIARGVLIHGPDA